MKYYFLALATILVVCVGCAGIDGQQLFPQSKGQYHAPPAAMLQRPGPMVDGPGPGVMPMVAQPFPAMGTGGGMGAQTIQVKFVGPAGTQIGWKSGDVFAENQLVAPGRYDFVQNASYQLKISNIPGAEREGLVLYPTLEVLPSHPTTEAYLAHNTIPLELTDDDLDQVQSSNMVTKVIYLPDARHQGLAIRGVETLSSTRLDPGVDPVGTARKRGTLMLILRIGNKDLEMPNAISGARNSSGIYQASAVQIDGSNGQFVPPTPVALAQGGFNGVPGSLIVAGAGFPGQSAFPVSGVGPTPVWGSPTSATPIGLPGPPSLPFGGRASLQSHTIRNNTRMNIPNQVDHLLIDVKHEPGFSLPKPVRHVRYTERHPVFSPGEVSVPRYGRP